MNAVLTMRLHQASRKPHLTPLQREVQISVTAHCQCLMLPAADIETCVATALTLLRNGNTSTFAIEQGKALANKKEADRK